LLTQGLAFPAAKKKKSGQEKGETIGNDKGENNRE
jgi:hypothetical protein